MAFTLLIAAAARPAGAGIAARPAGSLLASPDLVPVSSMEDKHYSYKVKFLTGIRH